MKSEQSKVCPACGTRNKAKWEFCANCGESLQNVALADTATPAAAATAIAESRPESSAVGTIFAALFMIAVAAGVVLWVQSRPPETENPVDAGVFQIATLPPTSAPVPKPAHGPEVADFDAGRQLLAAGNVAAALQAFARALEKAPENPDIHSFYAQALLQAGQRDDAIRHFEDAARLSPDNKYRLGLAAALNQLGRTDQAIDQYQQVLTSDPREEQALKELGSLLNRAGRYKEASSYLARAAEQNPTDMVLQQDLGWSLEAQGDLDQAAEAYRKVLAAAPQATVSRGRLAEVLLRQKKSAEALALVEEGLARDPAAPLLKRARASLLERNGRIAEAIAEYRAYARIATNADDARLVTERAEQLEKKLSGGT